MTCAFSDVVVGAAATGGAGGADEAGRVQPARLLTHSLLPSLITYHNSPNPSGNARFPSAVRPSVSVTKAVFYTP